MGVFKVQKRDNPFVQIDKTLVFDERLSFKAKGILMYLLSRPNDWEVYETEIMKHAKDGRDSIRNGIKELIECGYIEREEARNEKGHFKGYHYSVYEVPNRSGLSVFGKPDVGKSNTTNIDSTNKESTNKDIYIVGQANDDFILLYYSKKYQNHFGKEHPPITSEQLEKVNSVIEEFSAEYDAQEEDWENAIDEHFNNLPKNNNGSILSFCSGNLYASPLVRYLEAK